jgi:anti-sigma B factor antagonist
MWVRASAIRGLYALARGAALHAPEAWLRSPRSSVQAASTFVQLLSETPRSRGSLRETMTYLLGHRAVTARRHLVVVGGELDLNAAPELRAAVGAAIDGGATTLVVDLSEVTFIDSTAIGVLLAARERLRHAGGTLELVCAEPHVLRVLEIVGLARVAGVR